MVKFEGYEVLVNSRAMHSMQSQDLGLFRNMVILYIVSVLCAESCVHVSILL